MTCDLGDRDGDYGIELSQRTVTRARKAHRCDECGRVVPVGVSYWVSSGVFDGQLQTIKLCSRCDKARRWLMSRGHSSWEVDHIREDVVECAMQERHDARRAGGQP